MNIVSSIAAMTTGRLIAGSPRRAGAEAVMTSIRTILIAALLFIAAAIPALAEAPADQPITLITRSAAQSDRLVIHVGATDGALEESLAKDGFVVQGLVGSEREKAAIQHRMVAQCLHGPATFGVWSKGTQLPYVENLADIVVVDRSTITTMDLSDAELMRIIRPEGIALVNADGRWKTVRKPRPAGMDEWLNPQHDIQGTRFSRDSLVGPPDHLQWVNGPGRAANANVVTREVVFSLHDRLWLGKDRCFGSVGAYNAYNGAHLWERDLRVRTVDEIQAHLASAGLPKPQVQALGQSHFAPSTYGYSSNGKQVILAAVPQPVCLDLLTGKTIVQYPIKEVVYRVIYAGDRVIFITDDAILCYRASTAGLLWKIPAGRPVQLYVENDRLAYVDAKEDYDLRLLNLSDGKLISKWPCGKTIEGMVEKNDDAPLPLMWQLVAFQNDIAYLLHSYQVGGIRLLNWHCWKGDALVAFDTKRGTVKWRFLPKKEGLDSIIDSEWVIVSPEKVWVGFIGKVTDKSDERGFAELDTATGAIGKNIPVNNKTMSCLPPYGTPYYIHPRTSWISHSGRKLATFGVPIQEVKGCGYVHTPANGVSYNSGHSCICGGNNVEMDYRYIKVMVRTTGAASPKPADGRLVSGDVDAKPDATQTPASSGEQWPMWAADARRSRNITSTIGPEGLKPVWETPAAAVKSPSRYTDYVFGGDLISGSTVANGFVYYSQPERNAVVAIDFNKGAVVWEFFADGRVDGPPTIDKGECYFGDEAGWIYAVSAASGKLIWKHQVAPDSRQILAHDRLRSYWPVKGSVLVHDNRIWALAGWFSQIAPVDAYVLNTADGKLLWTTRGAKSGSSKFRRNIILNCEDGAVFAPYTGPQDRIDQYDIKPFRSLYREGAPSVDASSERWIVYDKERTAWYFITTTPKETLGEEGWKIMMKKGGEGPPWQRIYAPGEKSAWVVDLKAKGEAAVALIGAGDALWAASYELKSPEKGKLRAIDKDTGKILAEYPLPGKPANDGLSAAGKSLIISLAKGAILKVE